MVIYKPPPKYKKWVNAFNIHKQLPTIRKGDADHLIITITLCGVSLALCRTSMCCTSGRIQRPLTEVRICVNDVVSHVGVLYTPCRIRTPPPYRHSDLWKWPCFTSRCVVHPVGSEDPLTDVRICVNDVVSHVGVLYTPGRIRKPPYRRSDLWKWPCFTSRCVVHPVGSEVPPYLRLDLRKWRCFTRRCVVHPVGSKDPPYRRQDLCKWRCFIRWCAVPPLPTLVADIIMLYTTYRWTS